MRPRMKHLSHPIHFARVHSGREYVPMSWLCRLRRSYDGALHECLNPCHRSRHRHAEYRHTGRHRHPSRIQPPNHSIRRRIEHNVAVLQRHGSSQFNLLDKLEPCFSVDSRSSRHLQLAPTHSNCALWVNFSPHGGIQLRVLFVHNRSIAARKWNLRQVELRTETIPDEVIPYMSIRLNYSDDGHIIKCPILAPQHQIPCRELWRLLVEAVSVFCQPR